MQLHRTLHQPHGSSIIWLIAIISSMLLLCACDTTGNVTISTPTTTPGARPSPTPTRAPTKATTPKPTATRAVIADNALTPAPGAARLGQPISHFLFVYGTPIQADANTGYFAWNRQLLTAVAAKDTHYTVSAVGDAIENGWDSIEVATPVCQSFMPADAVYQRKIGVTAPNPALERIYHSASLAPLFPASLFTDENGNMSAPGTFAVIYYYDMTNATRIDHCDIDISLVSPS